MFEAIGNAISSAFKKLGEIITNWIMEGLMSLFGWIAYLICRIMCRLVNIVYQMFAVLSGLETVTYTSYDASGVAQTEEDYLINIFFQHSAINNLYWGMALIGMVMAFAFTMIAVIRKAGDINGEQKASMGQILGALGKSILLMLCMNLIISVTLTATNVLLQSISALFDNPYAVTQENKKTFTSDDYKTMNEIFQTIGAYSLNPSYSSRYNLNSCFNAIRPKLLHLQENNMFNVYYTTSQAVIVNGVATTQEVETWQSALQKIVRSASLDEDVKLDVYHEELNQALLDIMDTLRYNQSAFKPLEYYEANYQADDKPADIDIVIFLSGTAEAAHNSHYNTNGSLTDPVRGPYYLNNKSIYNYNQVKGDFVTKLGGINYLMVGFLCFVVFKELIRIMLACVVRMFQMLLLYISAPPIIAIMPLDGGEKFKQWTLAFVIQNFSIFGTVISMRLLMLFIPIVFSSNLVLFDNFFMNILCKIFIVYGGFVAVGRSSGLITGILANNAGWQAIQAGDVRAEADSMMSKTGLDKLAAAPLTAAKLGADASGLTTLANKATAPFREDSQLRQGWREHGGVSGYSAFQAQQSGGGAGGGGDSGDSGGDTPGNNGSMGGDNGGGTDGSMPGNNGSLGGDNGGGTDGSMPGNNSSMGGDSTPSSQFTQSQFDNVFGAGAVNKTPPPKFQ